MKQATIVAVVLAVLLVIAVVQAFQLSGLKSKVAGGQVNVKSASVQTAQAANNAPIQAQSTPDLSSGMVGGC